MSEMRSPDPTPCFCLASNLAPRCVEWLWPGRLALGKLAILEGDPGLSKSFLALDLCARLSSGRPWPDDTAAPAPAACVFLNGEDGAEDTLGPRLRALGADLGRIFILDRQEDDGTPPFSLPAQVAALEALVARTQARLVVIDPIMAFFGPGVNPASDQSIRRALAPLATLARRCDCVILLIRHLNKVGRGRALYRGLGSIGLVGACRSAWLVAEEPGGSARRVLAQVKNNLAPPQPSLAFEIEQGPNGSAMLHWLGPVAASADVLLAQERLTRELAPCETASAFLSEVLADGPVAAREIWRRAEQEGISLRTLRRARQTLEVSSVRMRVDGRFGNYWSLPEHGPPPEDDLDSLEEWLRPLRERYPPSTPLDDL
jgi:hypothetical protein